MKRRQIGSNRLADLWKLKSLECILGLGLWAGFLTGFGPQAWAFPPGNPAIGFAPRASEPGANQIDHQIDVDGQGLKAYVNALIHDLGAGLRLPDAAFGSVGAGTASLSNRLGFHIGQSTSQSIRKLNVGKILESFAFVKPLAYFLKARLGNIQGFDDVRLGNFSDLTLVKPADAINKTPAFQEFLTLCQGASQMTAKECQAYLQKKGGAVLLKVPVQSAAIKMGVSRVRDSRSQAAPAADDQGSILLNLSGESTQESESKPFAHLNTLVFISGPTGQSAQQLKLDLNLEHDVYFKWQMDGLRVKVQGLDAQGRLVEPSSFADPAFNGKSWIGQTAQVAQDLLDAVTQKRTQQQNWDLVFAAGLVGSGVGVLAAHFVPTVGAVASGLGAVARSPVFPRIAADFLSPDWDLGQSQYGPYLETTSQPQPASFGTPLTSATSWVRSIFRNGPGILAPGMASAAAKLFTYVGRAIPGMQGQVYKKVDSLLSQTINSAKDAAFHDQFGLKQVRSLDLNHLAQSFVQDAAASLSANMGVALGQPEGEQFVHFSDSGQDICQQIKTDKWFFQSMWQLVQQDYFAHHELTPAKEGFERQFSWLPKSADDLNFLSEAKYQQLGTHLCQQVKADYELAYIQVPLLASAQAELAQQGLPPVAVVRGLLIKPLKKLMSTESHVLVGVDLKSNLPIDQRAQNLAKELRSQLERRFLDASPVPKGAVGSHIWEFPLNLFSGSLIHTVEKGRLAFGWDPLRMKDIQERVCVEKFQKANLALQNILGREASPSEFTPETALYCEASVAEVMKNLQAILSSQEISSTLQGQHTNGIYGKKSQALGNEKIVWDSVSLVTEWAKNQVAPVVAQTGPQTEARSFLLQQLANLDSLPIYNHNASNLNLWADLIQLRKTLHQVQNKGFLPAQNLPPEQLNAIESRQLIWGFDKDLHKKLNTLAKKLKEAGIDLEPPIGAVWAVGDLERLMLRLTDQLRALGDEGVQLQPKFKQQWKVFDEVISLLALVLKQSELKPQYPELRQCYAALQLALHSIYENSQLNRDFNENLSTQASVWSQSRAVVRRPFDWLASRFGVQLNPWERIKKNLNQLYATYAATSEVKLEQSTPLPDVRAGMQDIATRLEKIQNAAELQRKWIPELLMDWKAQIQKLKAIPASSLSLSGVRPVIEQIMKELAKAINSMSSMRNDKQTKVILDEMKTARQKLDFGMKRSYRYEAIWDEWLKKSQTSDNWIGQFVQNVKMGRFNLPLAFKINESLPHQPGNHPALAEVSLENLTDQQLEVFNEFLTKLFETEMLNFKAELGSAKHKTYVDISFEKSPKLVRERDSTGHYRVTLDLPKVKVTHVATGLSTELNLPIAFVQGRGGSAPMSVQVQCNRAAQRSTYKSWWNAFTAGLGTIGIYFSKANEAEGERVRELVRDQVNQVLLPFGIELRQNGGLKLFASPPFVSSAG